MLLTTVGAGVLLAIVVAVVMTATGVVALSVVLLLGGLLLVRTGGVLTAALVLLGGHRLLRLGRLVGFHGFLRHSKAYGEAEGCKEKEFLHLVNVF